MTFRFAPLTALLGLMLMAFVQSTSGTPLPNIQVGLEPQSGGPVLTAATAGPNAEAVFNVTPGLYRVFVANGSTLPGPATITVFEGQQQRTSGVISRVAGRVHAPNATSQGLMMVNTGTNAFVRLRLATWQPQPPATPLCLTLPNGSPRFISAEGSASGYGSAMTAARAEWSRQANAWNAPGQPNYADWGAAARTNVRSSVRSGLPPITTVFLVGQPCRRP